MSENEAPIRVCCGQRHHGPGCPDGLVMCCLCFNRVTLDRLHILERGDGINPSTAPIYEDVCATCKKRETRWGTALAPDAPTPPPTGPLVEPVAVAEAGVCERVCEYAMDVGLPEYSGLRDKPEGCGNCDHYLTPRTAAPTTEPNHPGDVLGDAAEVASEGERNE